MSQSRISVTVGRGGEVVQRRAISTEMYSERSTVAGNSRKRSIRDRLGGEHIDQLGSGQLSSSKRQRQDEASWRLDQQSSEDRHMQTQLTNISNGSQDLRTKLVQKNALRAAQAADYGSSAVSVKDLREKLVGPVSVPQVEHRQELQRHAVPLVRGTSAAVAPGITRLVGARANPITKNPSVEEQTVGALLQSLGLSKYLISFQVDMAALRHMSDEDLKELGLPMGPRKKILLALSSRR
ncbi:hypothetical protein O6H91_02G078600 [Diphasiastrum complanatum]|uniref:Uncharacterized protein n=1 Tax=Diphasiastrum complanatum TaxID=34168 RepID=A0ACC2EHF0_DIPCM|nr:hypothetical protein O6H91_02G078600 [Diphasiastrum complanatum]